MGIDNEKNISSDIYKINDYVDNVRRNFTPNVNEETMMLGIFGYFDQIFSDTIQNTVTMASEFSNESIANKAKFEKNIIAHALGLGLSDINAQPANFDVILTFLEDDIERALKTTEDKAWKFTFDKNNAIFFGDYEFHTDYDIVINKVKVNTAGSGVEFAYTAKYDIDVDNGVSDITNPYLAPPIRIKTEGLRVIMIGCKLHQVKHQKVYSKVLSDSSISSKILNFSFEGQLADFTIDVNTGSGSIHMVPIYEGLSLLATNTKYPYFYYTYLDANTIRIKFDRNSYIPKINSEVTINIQTTMGSDGNFTYDETVWPVFDFSSERLGYSNITCEVRPVTGISDNGSDRKTIEELKKIIPKEALSRGSITNLSDLENYFNTLDSMGKLHLYKKRDNALERLYYSFMVLKNSMDVIVPTNTIDIKVTPDQLLHEADGKYVFNRGTLIRYNGKYGYIDTPAEGSDVPVDFDKNSYNDFLYTIPYNFSICKDPLFGTYYLTTINENKLLEFTHINDQCVYQYIATSVNFSRGYTVNRDKYTLSVQVQQNVVNPDMTLVTYEPIPDGAPDGFIPQIAYSKVHCYVVFYDDKGNPYKWSKAIIDDFDSTGGNLFTFKFEFNTSDNIDIDNRIKISSNIYNPGDTVEAYGFFKSNTKAKLFIVSDLELDKGQNDGEDNLAEIIPDLGNRSWTNTYTVLEGLDFFYDFSEIINSTISVNRISDMDNTGCGDCSSACTNFCTSCTGNCAGSCIEECSNTCTVSCVDGCTTSCADDCSSMCTTSCGENCTNTCTDGCTGSCVGYCGGNCTNGCTSGCANNCENTCTGNCTANCASNCYGTCAAGCLTSCSYVCFTDCMGGCKESCVALCTGTCIGNCESGCMGTCSGSCSTNCGSQCSNSASNNGGNSNCNGDCVASCLGNCISSCSDMCSTTEQANNTVNTTNKRAIEIVGSGNSDGDPYAMVIIGNNNFSSDITLYVDLGTKLTFWVRNSSEDNDIANLTINGKKYKISQTFTVENDTKINLSVATSMGDKGGKISVSYIPAPISAAATLAVFELPESAVNDIKDKVSQEVALMANRRSYTRTEFPYHFTIKQVPVIKYDYFTDEEVVDEFYSELITKKSYIDYAVQILEDAFGIDFKFFNTYGPGRLCTLDNEGIVPINRTNLSMTFKVKLSTSYNTNILNDILTDIKAEVENIEEISSLHIPNIITNITSKYRESLIYFEFADMNGYGPGVQHIYAQEMPDGVVVPELLNVNTKIDGTPDINLILV